MSSDNLQFTMSIAVKDRKATTVVRRTIDVDVSSPKELMDILIMLLNLTYPELVLALKKRVIALEEELGQCRIDYNDFDDSSRF